MLQSQYTAPAVREVPIDLYTTAGWVQASFLIPQNRALMAFANQDHDFFKLKNVRLPGLSQTVPFFMLQRREVVLFIPRERDSVPATVTGDRDTKDVSCAFTSGVASGRLEVNRGLRVSDFILNKVPFFELHGASLFIRTSSTPEIRKDIPCLMISRWRIIGVSEPRFV